MAPGLTSLQQLQQRHQSPTKSSMISCIKSVLLLRKATITTTDHRSQWRHRVVLIAWHWLRCSIAGAIDTIDRCISLRSTINYKMEAIRSLVTQWLDSPRCFNQHARALKWQIMTVLHRGTMNMKWSRRIGCRSQLVLVRWSSLASSYVEMALLSLIHSLGHSTDIQATSCCRLILSS